MRLFSIILLIIIFIALALLLFGCTYNVYLVKDNTKPQGISRFGIEPFEPRGEIMVPECDVPGCLVVHLFPSEHDFSPDCDVCGNKMCPSYDTLNYLGGLQSFVKHRKIKL